MSLSHRIVLASNNAGKLREMQPLFASKGLDVIAQKTLGVDDADETGLTFVENAIIKARHAATLTGLPAIADDSGLEVDALNGEPGIYSARFSGSHASDATNCDYLLEKLKNVPEQQRQARYHCVLVYMRHATDPTPFICHGSWQGRILDAPIGKGGFGYDPLFYVPSHHCSAAQMEKDEKNRISHRAQAMKKLAAFLLADTPLSTNA